MAQAPMFDAVIVGAGMAGALIAKRLGEAGKKVLILEAGQAEPPNVNEYMNRFFMASAKVPESPYPPDSTELGITDIGQLNAGRPTSLMLGDSWNKPAVSYFVQTGNKPFSSTYERVAGGTARHWLGITPRFVPSDFKMQSTYQKFVDWPIDYQKLAPFYADAEKELGVSGSVEAQDGIGIPFDPAYTYPMPLIPNSFLDTKMSEGLDGLMVEGLPVKVSNMPVARNSQPYQQRRVCAGNTNCIPICPIQAKYDPTVTLNDAMATGNVTIQYQTVAKEIILDGNGNVSRIDYIRYSHPVRGRGPTEQGSVAATTFIIAAHAIETPMLLLRSKSTGAPDGVANGSRMVGKNLMDHPYYVCWGSMKDGPDGQVWPYRGPLLTSGIESMRDGAFRSRRGAFRVDIGNEGWNFVVGGIGGDPNVTTVDFVNGRNRSGTNDAREALFGTALTEKLNAVLTRQIRFGFLVEQEAEERNCVTLAKQTDGLGLARPEIKYDLSEYTRQGLIMAKRTGDQIFTKLGAKQLTKEPEASDPAQFEANIDGRPTRIGYYGAGHIAGTYRMGSDPDKSVVNEMQQSWQHKNLFLVGSGTFPTIGTANPSLTIAALALRTAKTILEMR